MTEHLNTPALLKWICAGLVAWWVRDVPAAMQTLIWFMVADYATGLVAAAIEGKLSSSAGVRGLVRKGGIICLLLFGHHLEILFGHEFDAETFGAFGYSVTEAISIVENFARIGVPMPARLIEALASVKHLRVKRATKEQLEALERE